MALNLVNEISRTSKKCTLVDPRVTYKDSRSEVSLEKIRSESELLLPH